VFIGVVCVPHNEESYCLCTAQCRVLICVCVLFSVEKYCVCNSQGRMVLCVYCTV